jgi:hypothetical protein
MSLVLGGPSFRASAAPELTNCFQDGFEDATALPDLFPLDLSRWHSTQIEPPGGNSLVELSAAPVHTGTVALRCATDAFGTDLPKADIVRFGFAFREGDDFWMSAWFYLESSPSSLSMFIADLEDTDAGSRGRRLYFTGTTGSQLACDAKFPASTVRQTPGSEIDFPKDQWVHIRWHMRLSSNSSLGLVEVWQDGAKILDSNTETLPSLGNGYDRLQIGITANGNTSSAQTLFVDDVSISDKQFDEACSDVPVPQVPLVPETALFILLVLLLGAGAVSLATRSPC